MRPRLRQFCSAAIGMALVLAAAPAGFARADYRMSPGMSAPPVSRLSIETAPGAKLLPSQFDSPGCLPVSVAAAPDRKTFCALKTARAESRSAAPQYGPLHRRPPPSFS